MLVHNTGTGVAFPQPLIIPGIGPNNSTTVVQTNPIRFNDDTPISTNTMILPGGQPFVPTPTSFLPGTLQLPTHGIAGLSAIHDFETFKKNQERTDIIG